MAGQRIAEVTLHDIESAQKRLYRVIKPTPLYAMVALQSSLQQNVHIKAETLLPVGSFKLRGAYNKIATLTPKEKEHGVITASAGNHALGVSLASKWLQTKATVVVPTTAPSMKKESCKALGANVIEAGTVYDMAYSKARQIEASSDKTYIHPVADADVIAGQGTIGLEILEQLPQVKQIIVPLGGGGLVSGIAIAVKSVDPSVKVIAVQPEGSDAYFRSYKAGKSIELTEVNTLADGLALKKIEPYLLKLIEEWVDDIVQVKESTIHDAIEMMLLQGKLVVEGAGAVALAAAIEGKIPDLQETVLLASGGNIDQKKLAGILTRQQ
ncbi:pyridoxal-phosphate dependent enzyme [Alkalihalobacillus oceani]|uniref:threonine ammonia-lyase n=1 Tax=Halalkalibacter oceani TaxID=1653776 RepID=UPI00203E697A|nr:threonine/serine dehydratase [Halalkalibacter oceani]MCM3759246.1 pyridoxal-phosphate dependent enzyme [Halalkalibacter oceani]